MNVIYFLQATYLILAIILYLLIRKKVKELNEIKVIRAELELQRKELGFEPQPYMQFPIGSLYHRLKHLREGDKLEMEDKAGWIVEIVVTENDRDHNSLSFSVDNEEYERGYHEIKNIKS